MLACIIRIGIPVATVLALVQPAVGRAAAQAQGFVVVVHRDNPVESLTRKEVADIFLKRTTTWTGRGGAIHPVDQPATSPVRGQFSRAVLGKAPSAVVSFWQQQIFSGRGVPPVERPSDAAVAETVRGDPGAIGYVTASAVAPDLKVVRISE